MTNITVDLPPPLSVNKLRRIDFASRGKAKTWRNIANGYLMLQKAKGNWRPTRMHCFELLVVLDESTVRCDADNALKMVIDYLKLIEMIEDDSPKHMRRVVVEWGEAPLGCRVTLRPWMA